MKSRIAFLLFGAALLLGACAKLPRQAPPWASPSARTLATPQPPSRGVSSEIELGQPEEEKRRPDLQRGHGQFVKPPESVRRPSRQGEYTLNFEDADLHEVVKVILGDLLQENYVIDPAVAGTVTIQSSYPLSREDLIPVLESLLKINDAVLVDSGGLFKIIPAENAFRESLPPSVGQRPSSSLGFRTQVVPLRYIGVDEVQKLLEPFLTEILIQADKRRNLLILAGPQRLLDNMIKTIQVFDVDWLKGMSLGLIPLEYVDAKTVVTELEAVFGGEDESTLGGMARFVPIERLNSVLIVTSQAQYLDEISGWLQRLDHSDGKAGQRLYVYYVQNAKASDLAATLNGVFGTGEGQVPGAEVAPGLEPVTLESEEPQEEGQQRRAPTEQQPTTGSELTLPGGSTVRIIADVVNNALVVFSSAADYQMIEAALKKLDIVPLQVLIEATIYEVTLTDNLRFGVEWFFRNTIGGSGRARGLLESGTNAALTATMPGFSYLISAGADVRAVLNTLASESRANILSAPALMVLDNQTATINVSDEVPIQTSERRPAQVAGAVADTINEIEFRDAGVILEVTPRVNASGLVTLEISQEVSQPIQTTTSTINSPTIRKRQVESTVAVDSGNTIVLGGLIQDTRSDTDSGVPGLYKIPVLGKLFGDFQNNFTRTEILVLITPRAVRNEEESLRVTEEFKRKLEQLAPPPPRALR